LLPIAVFALEIQRDAQDAFVFADAVFNLNSQACQSDVLFTPENASFYGDSTAPGVPFRTYIIALPNSTPPNVQVENLKSEALKGKPCGAEQNPKTLKVGTPYLRDNLWRVKINVPLLYSTGNSWNLRKNFRLRVNFNGLASGYSVGKRAISSVENKNGAARFGTAQAKLARAMQSPSEGVEFLLRIGIGTRDLSMPADGMHALPYDSLEKINREIYGTHISNLRIFSAPPDTLPELVGEEIFPNAVEIPIIVKDKNNDGIFNSGDSIVFFGYGTAIWKKSNSASGMDYYFSHSPYSYYQYFYLGIGGTKKELNRYHAKNISNPKDIAWKKYARSEKDLILRDTYFGDYSVEENTGKEWFWEWCAKNGNATVNPSEFQNSVINLNGLQGNSILIGVSFFPKRDYSSISWEKKMGINFNFSFQNQLLSNQNIKDTIFGGTFVFEAANASSSNNLHKLEISGNSEHVRFDGLSVAYNYDITRSAGNEWLFPGTAKAAVKIPVPANMELIKTENFIPTEILEGTNGYASDTISNNGDTKYFLQRKNSYKTPAFIEAIPNRINSISQPMKIHPDTEYLILTSEILQSGAVNLKRFRESGEASTKFKTAIVLAEDIYKEHGAQKNSAVAIRDYIRYAKNRCLNLKYVLLAGGGNYDYRNIRPNSKSNLIPPYEAEDYSSDDFYIVLEPGEMIRFGNYNYSDLAIGRLPVLNMAEFENYIKKAMDYEKISEMDNGIWRNTIIFSSDDSKQGDRFDNINPTHTQEMERTAISVESQVPEQDFLELRKISLLQYEKDGSNKKPEASKELQLRLNQGALFTFFYGHGNTVQWADEDFLNTSSLNYLSNFKRYTILGSFSCMVARFDDVATTGLSEVFVTAKDKGAIASIGALRTSYSRQNVNLAEKVLSNALFIPNVFLGEAILKAKQSEIFYKYNNEKYVLLGEPVLSIPRQKTSLNLNSALDTIKALQKLEISGNASINTGVVRMQVLEGDRNRTITEKNCDDLNYCTATIKVQGNPIYSEELQIKDGKFSTEFITPRKLSLGDNNAQIRLWSYKPGSAEIGRMAFRGISLFGTDTSFVNSIKDNTPPSIKIYPCMRSGIAAPFAENAQVSLEIPACLDIVIEDSTGLDYREEADEGISFEVSPVENPWHPWSFSEQTGKRAVAKMNFGQSYNSGEYVFKVQAQDILGNVAFRSLRVVLSQENKEGLADIFNVPNPMKKSGTTFYFKDLSGDRQSSVAIKIFDQNGKLVKTINNAISGKTHWDGRDSRGRLLANGLYHYVVLNTVQPLSETGSKRVFEKKQKLVISR